MSNRHRLFVPLTAASLLVVAVAGCSNGNSNQSVVAASGEAAAGEELFFVLPEGGSPDILRSDVGGTSTGGTPAVVALKADDGTSVRIVVVDSTDQDEAEQFRASEPVLVVQSSEDFAEGLLRSDDGLEVGVVISEGNIDDASGQLTAIAESLVQVDPSDPLQGMTLDPASGFTEVGRIAPSTERILGAGGSVHYPDGTPSGVTLKFRSLSPEEALLDLQVGSRMSPITANAVGRVVVDENGPSTPTRVTTIIDNYLISIESEGEPAGLTEMLGGISRLNLAEWNDLTQSVMEPYLTNDPYASFSVGGGTVDVFETPEASALGSSVACLEGDGDVTERCSFTTSLDPLLAELRSSDTTLLFGAFSSPVESVTVNGTEAPLATQEEWQVIEVPLDGGTSPLTVEARLPDAPTGDLEPYFRLHMARETR